jgi:hypothetical protein
MDPAKIANLVLEMMMGSQVGLGDTRTVLKSRWSPKNLNELSENGLKRIRHSTRSQLTPQLSVLRRCKPE